MPQQRTAANAVHLTGSGLPAGTVTFLFTDIEGSTRLLRETGSAYPGLLDAHRRLVRAAVAAHGGHEVDTQGDSFFLAFPGPRQAVDAAIDAQRSLAAHPWPDGHPVRVRMGLHTGEATAAGEGYIGLAVHAAARIAAAAHGGQTLVSEATAVLLADALPTGVSLADLGEHRLKDFPSPVRLYQLDVPGLPADFPPLRTLIQGYRLPAPSSPIVGREEDLAALVRLLADEGTRLVTLTGPGGIGKTRLALEAARASASSFPGGVVFVPLAAVTEPSLVVPRVAEAVGARREAGVDLIATVVAAVGNHRTLLLLDNMEQVADAAGEVAALLDRAPAVVALVTSRQLLRLRVERHHPVSPLATTDAVRLFAERAAAVRPEFTVGEENAAAVAEICERLDGLPLAIELAAARVRILPPEALLERLRERLDVVAGGPVDLPERQRTLRATVNWSYDLLHPHEQALFVRLAVFAGDWTLEAAEAVGGRPGEPDVLDTVTALVDASLVVSSTDEGEPRFRMLQTVHFYAAELLGRAPDRDETGRRHTAWVCAVTGALRRGRSGREHRALDERFEHERADLRAAVRRALDSGDVATVGILLRDAFVELAQRDAEAQAVEWLDRALTARDPGLPEVRGRLLVVRALAATIFGDFSYAHGLLAEAEPLLPETADYDYDRAIAAATAAYAAVEEDPGHAMPLVTDAAARLAATGDELGRAYMEVTAGNVALFRSDLTSAEQHYTASARLAEHLGDDAMRGRASSLLGLTLLLRGDGDAARYHVVEGARINRRGGQPTGMAYSLDGLAALALAQGRPVTTARALGAARAAREGAGHPPSTAFLPLLDDLTSRARSQLGVEAFEAAASEGRRWSAVEALDRLLEELSAPAPTRTSQ